MAIKLGGNSHPFFDALNERVEAFFQEQGVKQTGNWKIISKTAVLFGAAISSFVLLLIFNQWYMQVLLWSILGLSFAGIGFNSMHDGAHGSYSSKRWLNSAMGYTLNAIGGNVFFWKLKHNQLHHVFTNIEGMDDDLDIKPFMRTNEGQKRYWFHKFQFLYWFVLYGLTYIFWVYYNDFSKYFGRKIGETPIRKIPVREHVIFWISKAFYIGVFFVVPVVVLGWKEAILGYLLMSFVCGWVIAVVFQLAHVVDGASFHIPAVDGDSLKDEWAIHQVKTTANFATKSKLVSWICGGLNFQVEHHLFPRISHVHYPKINKIVRDTCREFGVQYREFPNVWQAVKAHVSLLKQLGKFETA